MEKTDNGGLMADRKCFLQGIKMSISTYLNQPQHWKNSVLAMHWYTVDALQYEPEKGIPTLRVPMTDLGADDSICHVWQSRGTPISGQYDAINYRYDDDYLFGVIVLPETLFEANTDKTPLQQAAECAYSQIFSLLDRLSFPYLFRVWNYMADINAHSFGMERYVQFNLGRQDAFLAHGRDIEGNVPAACALGFESALSEENSDQNALTISFLAGRVEAQCIENPRQISAYQYPQQYGPRSPTFSRASLVKLGLDDVLFISGTASIVGHTTLHPDDVIAQTRETMENIKAVLAEANRRLGHTKFELSDLDYTVYVRHNDDFETIRKELMLCVGDGLKAVYLQANVCRHDLLLEIEAIVGHRSTYSDSSHVDSEHAN